MGDGGCPNFKPQYQSTHINGERKERGEIMKKNKIIKLIKEKKLLTALMGYSIIMLIIGISFLVMIPPFEREGEEFILPSYNPPSYEEEDNGDNGDDDNGGDEPPDPPSTLFDVVCYCVYIVDGDTFDGDMGTGRVRLADIDCPESPDPPSENYLTSLIDNKKVYLDLDDKDQYDRWIALVLVRYNSTHLLNINKKMVDMGYAVIWDFPNAFNPYTWETYYYYEV